MKWVPRRKVELYLMAEAKGFTLLRPGFFAQNLKDAYRRDIVEFRRRRGARALRSAVRRRSMDAGAVDVRRETRPRVRATASSGYAPSGSHWYLIGAIASSSAPFAL